MNINWVLADELILAPDLELSKLKNLGSFWGSWRTWRSYQTDNVICHDMSKTNDLIKRQLYTTCNLYIPSSIYKSLDQPVGVKVYEGEFLHQVDHQEEIVAMHLTATVSDIVLLLGFDFSEKTITGDKLIDHRNHNYKSLVVEAIKNNKNVQWVLIDHPDTVYAELKSLPNLQLDKLDNVLNMAN